jgi:hypothetical protein
MHLPFTKLVQHIGTDEWERREREVGDDEVTTFEWQQQQREELELILGGGPAMETYRDYTTWKETVDYLVKEVVSKTTSLK